MTHSDQTMNKDEYADFVVEELAGLGPVTQRKMFGGIGFFLEGVMFAKVSGDGTLYFRVDDTNRSDYEQLGSTKFYMENKKKGMPYYRVPGAIIADRTRLIQWGQKAFAVAVANKKS